jgi:small subunit ribosomal protein S17
MTEEERTEPEEQPEDAAEQPGEGAEEAAAGEAPAEEAAAEEAPAEDDESSAEEAAEAGGAEEEAGPSGAPVAQAEPEEAITPKERRKRERAHAAGPARAPRSPEERAAERAERRQAAAIRRRRYRQRQRAKRGEPRQGTPPAERDRPHVRKVREGRVVSNLAEKTITVEIEIVRRHPMYEKVVRRSRTVHAHDERNEASEGDRVRVVESRPLSRTKRWRLLEIVERAPSTTPVPAGPESEPA